MHAWEPLAETQERQVLTAAFLSVEVASLGVQQVLQPIHDMMYTDTRRMDLPR